MDKSIASEKIRLVLKYFLSGKIDVSEFCAEFETEYNMNTSPGELSKEEEEVYSDLLKVTAWYSPFAGDRRKVPNYVDENAVKTAAHLAAKRLRL